MQRCYNCRVNTATLSANGTAFLPRSLKHFYSTLYVAARMKINPFNIQLSKISYSFGGWSQKVWKHFTFWAV